MPQCLGQSFLCESDSLEVTVQCGPVKCYQRAFYNLLAELQSNLRVVRNLMRVMEDVMSLTKLNLHTWRWEASDAKVRQFNWANSEGRPPT